MARQARGTRQRATRAMKQRAVRRTAQQAVKLAKAGRCGEAKRLANRSWNHALWHAHERSRRLAVEVASRAGMTVAQLCVD